MKKRIFLSLIILISVLALGAVGIEEALKTIFTYSEVIEHEGDEVLMTSSFFSNEGDAYNWVANCAQVVLAIRAGWASAPNPYDSKVKSLDAIGAVWQTEYQTYVISIPVWEILENFMEDENAYKDSSELLSELRSYIDYYGDISPLSMY